MLPTLTGERLALRPTREDDLAALAELRATPEVMEWWGPHDEEADRDYLLGGWVSGIGGAVGGWLEFTEETEPMYRSVSLDLFVAPPLIGHGYGPEALRLAIDHFVAAGHHRFTIDPTVSNARAVHAYESVGFRPVGVLRKHERAPDGTWRDGLLMDLLAEDLG